MAYNISQKKLSLFIVRPTMAQGGADRVTLTLLQTLDRNLFELSLILMKVEGEYLSDIPQDVIIYDLKASSLWVAWYPLAKLIGQKQPNIIFSTSSGMNLAAVVAHLINRRRGRLVISERNVLLHGRISAKKRLMLLLKALLYKQAHRITAVSQGVKNDLVSKLHLAPEKISTVYNPVVTDNIKVLAAEQVDHPWFEDEIPIILGVGRLVVEKDFSTLIKAFAQVRAKRKVKLLILGDGPLREALLALIHDLDMEKEAYLPGFDKNPFKYMARCSVFVLSSRFEGLPGVLIQAMACSAPVISTDCPVGPSEIITPEVDGFLVPVGDVTTLAKKINYLLDNPDLRQGIGQQAQQTAKRYKVDAILHNYVSALLGDEQMVTSLVSNS